MNLLFATTFLVGLGYREYKKRKDDFIFKAVIALMTPKKSEEVSIISKAKRTASKTLIVKYQYSDTEYELILPVTRKKQKWVKCMAVMKDGEVLDHTDLVKSKAGPYGNFYGMKLLPNQIIRGATKLHFLGQNHETIMTI